MASVLGGLATHFRSKSTW